MQFWEKIVLLIPVKMLYLQKQVADENKIKLEKVLLICKAFHARRFLMFYQSAFLQVKFLVVPFEGYDILKSNWFQSEYGIKKVRGSIYTR